MKNGILRVIGVALIISALLASVLPAAAENPSGEYLQSVSDFVHAIEKGADTVYVGDIDFSKHEQVITFRRSVNIVGYSDGSMLTAAHFSVEGSGVTVGFTNLVFKGDYYFGDKIGNKPFINAKGNVSLSVDNCSFRSGNSVLGSAICFTGDAGSLTVSNCSFYDNFSEVGTVFFRAKGGGCTVSNSEFTRNYAFSGAGLYLSCSRAQLEEVTVTFNYTADTAYKLGNPEMPRQYPEIVQGGGLYACGFVDQPMELTASRCSFSDNSVATYGGGVALRYANAKFIECEMSRNLAQSGGGMLIYSGASEKVYAINSKVSFNRVDNTEAAVMVKRSSAASGEWLAPGYIEFSRCTLESNTATDTSKFVYRVGTEDDVSPDPETSGAPITLYGCLIIDPTLGDRGASAPDYTGIAVSAPTNYVSIPMEVYTTWGDGYYKEMQEMTQVGVLSGNECAHKLELCPAAPSGKDTEGNIEHRVCTVCGQMFAVDSFDVLSREQVYLPTLSSQWFRTWATVGGIAAAVILVILAIIFIIRMNKNKKAQKQRLRMTRPDTISALMVTRYVEPLKPEESMPFPARQPEPRPEKAESRPEPVKIAEEGPEEDILPTAPSAADGKTEPEELTDRQKRILELIVSGKTHAEIMAEVICTESVLKREISQIYGKTGTAGRKQLIEMYSRKSE